MTMLPIMYLLNIKADFQKKTLRYVFIASICLVGYNYNYLKGKADWMAGLGGVIVPTFKSISHFYFGDCDFKSKHKKERYHWYFVWIGGGLILLEIWKFSFQELTKSGNLFFIIAAVIWAGATICTQKARSELNAVNFSLWLYLVAILAVLPITPLNSIMDVFKFDWIFWMNFLVISALSLGFGTTIFFLATMKIGSHKTSSFMYVVPISAVGFSVLFLGEPLALSTIIGGGFAIFGVYLVNLR
ncbi:MAG: hypothetical protein Ct9H300mP18_07660 [Candidatus Neomarinimicrobiota bacterium]|nr:MAG: hypothetical protein Ct9H300mP18_07660 [Candidatus Neomarinimicrobiota bacterium]